MIPIHELLSRIRWDAEFARGRYVIGYWDRVEGRVLHADLREMARQLAHWPIVASGTEGYRTAEVTLGGVDTDELSSSTMESKKAPGLYFIGEVVDVTGHLGGYNFQWAWASGHAAGSAA